MTTSKAMAAPVLLTYTLSPLTKLNVYADNFADDHGHINVTLSYELIDSRIRRPMDLGLAQQNKGHLSIQEFSLPRGVNAQVFLPAPDSKPVLLPIGVSIDVSSSIHENMYEEGFFVVRHNSAVRLGSQYLPARFTDILDIEDSIRKLTPQRYQMAEPSADIGFNRRHFSFTRVHSRLVSPPPQDLVVSIADTNEHNQMRALGTVAMDATGSFYVLNENWNRLSDSYFEFQDGGGAYIDILTGGSLPTPLKDLKEAAVDWPGLTGNRDKSKPRISLFPTEDKSVGVRRRTQLLNSLKSIKIIPEKIVSVDLQGKTIVRKNPLASELDRGLIRRLENEAAALDTENEIKMLDEHFFESSFKLENDLLERSGVREELRQQGASILGFRTKLTDITKSASRYALISAVYDTRSKKGVRSTWVARLDSKTGDVTGLMLLPNREKFRDIHIFPGGHMMDAKGGFLDLQNVLPGRCELLFR